MSNPHQYNTPEWMMHRLAEWIGENGGEDSTTLMVYEARETIKKLAAQQDADKVDAERWRYARTFGIHGLPELQSILQCQMVDGNMDHAVVMDAAADKARAQQSGGTPPE